MPELVSIITILLSLSYSGLILYFRKGWNSLKIVTDISSGIPQLSFSIIIPARNEKANIRNCLEDLILQDYPPQLYETLVMDDFSEDDTGAIVDDFKVMHPGYQIRLIKLADEPASSSNSYKKTAISIGIQNSAYDWIITSDADCKRGKNWLKSIENCIKTNNPVMVSAPVCFHPQQDFFGKAQSLEFMGLIGIGGASIANRNPNLCNGANLVYRKDAFYEVNGFKGNDDIASGDDEFLMHKMHLQWPGKIFFLKNPQAIVYTNPENTFTGFIQQRKRWVSKSRKYTKKNITAILTAAWLFHFCLLFCLVGGFFNYLYFIAFLVAFGIKVLAEYLFLSKVAGFFNQKTIVKLLIPSAFLYIFYVLFIGIYGNFGTYRWKGRDVR